MRLNPWIKILLTLHCYSNPYQYPYNNSPFLVYTRFDFEPKAMFLVEPFHLGIRATGAVT